MSNKVILGKNDIIFNIYQGDQTTTTVANVVSKTRNIIEILRRKKQPVYILADLSKMGKSNFGSRLESVEALKTMRYNKVALFGANLFVKHLANFIIIASGRQNKIKYCNSKDEAIKWLLY